MKTETQVTIKIGEIKASEYLETEIFFASSRKDTKSFKLNGLKSSSLNQTLKIANIGGKELQFWLCSNKNTIIANAKLSIPSSLNVQQQIVVDFKMTSTPIALLNASISVSSHQIEKPLYVEPDQQLLKKVQNPYERLRKEEQEARRLKQLEDLQAASKQVKKPAITITKFNKKEVPFV